MKNLLVVSLLLCIFSITSNAQEKPGKLRYSAGFFTTNYEIGDLDASQKDVLNHLEKYNANAYYDFKRGISLDNQSTIWLLASTAGLLVAVTSKNDGWILAGAGLTLIGGSISLYDSFAGARRKEKAINTYNSAFGYR